MNQVPEYPAMLDEQEEVPNFFDLYDDHRTAILVDGPNIGASGKLSNRRLNFDALRLMCAQHSDLRFANYYSPIYRNEQFQSTMQKFFEYLAHSRWNVITREGFHTSSGKYRAIDIDPLLGSQMQLLAASGKIDTILLVTNDGDYVPIIQTCREVYGVRVLHLSWSARGADGSFARPSHTLRIESEISLDVSMDRMRDVLLMPK